MSAARTTKVAVGIIAASTAVGAVAGIATAAVVVAATGSPQWIADREVLAAAGTMGAACGAVLGPLAAFGFLRRVPSGNCSLRQR